MIKHFKYPLNKEIEHRNLPKQQQAVESRDSGVTEQWLPRNNNKRAQKQKQSPFSCAISELGFQILGGLSFWVGERGTCAGWSAREKEMRIILGCLILMIFYIFFPYF